jgi:adenine phosphoribosyltransferase
MVLWMCGGLRLRRARGESSASPPPSGETFRVCIAGVPRELRIVRVKPGLRIALIETLGDPELVVASASRMLELAPEFDVAIAPETGGIVLAHQIAVESGLPYVIARKRMTPAMTAPLSAEVRSIKAVARQTLYVGDRDAERLRDRRVLLVDDVVSTGSTMAAVERIVAAAGGDLVARVALATEGARHDDVIALAHLPLFE